MGLIGFQNSCVGSGLLPAGQSCIVTRPGVGKVFLYEELRDYCLIIDLPPKPLKHSPAKTVKARNLKL